MPGSIRTMLTATLLFVALAAGASAQTSSAQNWPNRPIRLLVPFPPGGAVDLIARLYGQALTIRLGQPVIIENKPGAGGNLASDIVAKAAPDGYTLLHGADNVFISNPHVYKQMPFDPFRDLAAVSSVSTNQYVLAIHPGVAAKTLGEFVDLARATKPPLFYASIGNGSIHHLAMEMLKRHVGIDLIHVPYRGGGPAALGLIAGDVSAAFGGNSVVPFVQTGKVRGLATAGSVRNPATPDLPTIAELYPGYEALSWHGLFVPVGTPQPIIDRLRTEIRAVLAQPEFAEKLANGGAGEPYITTPEAFAVRMKGDYEKYGNLIRALGIKLE